MMDRDGIAGHSELERYVLADGVVERELALLGQLQDADRDKALRDAADAV